MKHGNPNHSAHRRWTSHLIALLAAWLLATAWGSVVQTQWNLQALAGLGVDIALVDRLRTTWQDLIGFAPVYAGILAAGWLPALAVGNWLGGRWPSARDAWLAAAGGAGMVAAVLAVDAVAPMPSFIDATRHLPGLLSMAAGAVLAGFAYGRLTSRAQRKPM
jgi:hypothetical protein